MWSFVYNAPMKYYMKIIMGLRRSSSVILNLLRAKLQCYTKPENTIFCVIKKYDLNQKLFFSPKIIFLHNTFLALF